MIRGLDHVAITVPTEQLDQARWFYSGVLGLEEASRPDAELGRPGVWYRLGNAELHVQCRDAAAPERSEQHLALVVEDAASLRERLGDQRVEIEDAPMLLGRRRFFCRDPFGNRIEFVDARS